MPILLFSVASAKQKSILVSEAQFENTPVKNIIDANTDAELKTCNYVLESAENILRHWVVPETS